MIISFFGMFYARKQSIYSREQSKIDAKRHEIEMRKFHPEIIIKQKKLGDFSVKIFNKADDKIYLESINSNYTFQLDGHDTESEYPMYTKGKDIPLGLPIYERCMGAVEQARSPIKRHMHDIDLGFLYSDNNINEAGIQIIFEFFNPRLDRFIYATISPYTKRVKYESFDYEEKSKMQKFE